MEKLSFITILCCILSNTFAGEAVAPEPYHWQNVVIGGGGFVTGLIAHPHAKDLIYARTDVGGAYRWEAAAHRWVPITDGFGDVNFTGIESLALDPGDTNRVYLAAGIYESGKAAIFRSENQGRTWQRTDVPFKMGGNETGRFNGERLVVDPADGRILFFGSRRDGLWKSADHGVTWNRVDSFPRIAADSHPAGRLRFGRPVGIISVLFDQTTIYAAISSTGTNLFSSTDGGGSWQPLPGQPLGLRPNHMVLAKDGTLYLSYGDEPGPNEMSAGAVEKFDPQKDLWTDVTPLKSPSDGQAFGYGAVTVDAQNPSVILATTFCRWKPHDEVFRSTNSGASWAPLLDAAKFDHSGAPYTAGIKPHWLGSIIIDPSDADQAWFTTGYGVWCCTNLTATDGGGTADWTFADAGLEETVPLALVSPPAGAHLLSGVGDIDGFRHDNLDAPPFSGSYAGPHFINTESIVFAAKDPKIIVRAGTSRNEMVHAAISTDGGNNWSRLESQPVPEESGGEVCLSADGKVILWTFRHQAPGFTVNRGRTWARCAGLDAGTHVVADTVNSARFYAFAARAGKVFVSLDGAANFSNTPAILPMAGGLRSGFGFDIPRGADLSATPGREGDLWLAFGGQGLWHSIDGGASFTRMGDVDAAWCLGFGRAVPGGSFPALFLSGIIGSQPGLFRSENAGKDWTRINDDGHQFGWVTKITGDPRIYGRVYLATAGRGIIYGDMVRDVPAGFSTADPASN